MWSFWCTNLYCFALIKVALLQWFTQLHISNVSVARQPRQVCSSRRAQLFATCHPITLPTMSKLVGAVGSPKLHSDHATRCSGDEFLHADNFWTCWRKSISVNGLWATEGCFPILISLQELLMGFKQKASNCFIKKSKNKTPPCF